MSLRQHLISPLVISPVDKHTHTVIFLHRFSADTTEHELRSKILSAKMTRDHRTLAEQFPSVRWVFPYPKDHARHWSNLSPEDKIELGLAGRLPYITQIILQEAENVGGLDKIVLGGQGETAEAAHDAMSSFPEPSAATRQEPEETATFIQENFFHPAWTQVSQLKLAGFVGMHAQDGHATRDVRNYSIATKTATSSAAATLNNAVVSNTPHKFINGGYKLQTTTWDGRRIDDFAAFLASIPGVHHLPGPVVVAVAAGSNGNDLLTPKHRPPPARIDRAQDELDAKLKYAEEIKRQKAEDEKVKERVLRRIEENRVERALKRARERENRLRGGNGDGPGFVGGTYSLQNGAVGSPGSSVLQANRDPLSQDDFDWDDSTEFVA